IGGVGGTPLPRAESGGGGGGISPPKGRAGGEGPAWAPLSGGGPGFLPPRNIGGGPPGGPRVPAEEAAQRRGPPREESEGAARHASDRASFVSGAIIPVDGGWSAKIA